ncbi:DNA-binding protein [Duganella sp. FT109W]|uniref:DNA-binding protein n=1 Tax=Duganella margarita TaxID=2692170 RepID=A0ABW9WBX4_9BURK|nr:DNA-binding protein [Duganella margarita]MYN37990.1 DNA-binding protein [Duganella margarita]
METSKKPPRVSVDLSPQLNARLEQICANHHLGKVDIMRRAFALFEVAVRANERSERLGIFDKDGKLVREIVGLL